MTMIVGYSTLLSQHSLGPSCELGTEGTELW